MKCKFCKKEFIPKAKAHNVKYCSQYCRNKVYYNERGGKLYQREYNQKVMLKDGRTRIQCKICGKWYRQVGTHIVQVHGVLARAYREAYGFDVKKGQLPEDYRGLKAEQAFECGGVKNLKKGKKFWFKRGQKGVGVYKRSPETMARLKVLHKIK